jgi:hypothetical protein
LQIDPFLWVRINNFICQFSSHNWNAEMQLRRYYSFRHSKNQRKRPIWWIWAEPKKTQQYKII